MRYAAIEGLSPRPAVVMAEARGLGTGAAASSDAAVHAGRLVPVMQLVREDLALDEIGRADAGRVGALIARIAAAVGLADFAVVQAGVGPAVVQGGGATITAAPGCCAGDGAPARMPRFLVRK